MEALEAEEVVEQEKTAIRKGKEKLNASKSQQKNNVKRSLTKSKSDGEAEDHVGEEAEESKSSNRKQKRLTKKPSRPLLSWKPTSAGLLAESEKLMLASTRNNI